jgi:hypothetical protein
VPKCSEIFILMSERPPFFTVTTMRTVIHSIAHTTVVLNHLKYPPVFWTPALKCNPRIRREREREIWGGGAIFLPSCKHMRLMGLHFLQRWAVILLPLSWPNSEHGTICLLKPIFNWRPPNSRHFLNPFNTAEQRSDPVTKENQSIPSLKKTFFSLLFPYNNRGKEKPKCIVIQEWNTSTDYLRLRVADPVARMEYILNWFFYIYLLYLYLQSPWDYKYIYVGNWRWH